MELFSETSTKYPAWEQTNDSELVTVVHIQLYNRQSSIKSTVLNITTRKENSITAYCFIFYLIDWNISWTSCYDPSNPSWLSLLYSI